MYYQVETANGVLQLHPFLPRSLNKWIQYAPQRHYNPRYKVVLALTKLTPVLE